MRHKMFLKSSLLLIWIVTVALDKNFATAGITLSLINPTETLIIDNGTVVPRFSAEIPTILDIRTFAATFSISSDVEVAFSLLLSKIPLTASVDNLSGIEGYSFINATPLNFTLDVSCAETSTVFFTLILTFSPSTGVSAPPEVFAIRFAKECRASGMSVLD
jgi:hypothetical protein